MTDPIADMITRVRNAYLARLADVSIAHSKTNEAIAEILKNEGYIDQVKVENALPQSQMLLVLSYKGKIPAVDGITRVSTPGRRIYTRAKRIPSVLGGYGTTIVSTNQGLMSGKEARKKNLGGEILIKVW